MYLFSIWDIIQVPFGYLLDGLYRLTTSYGWSLVLFAIIVRIVLIPTTAKSKKNSMKMSRLAPQVQYLQKKYENDKQKQGAALQQLYKEEGVSMGAGCLWSLVPLLIMIPLYTVVREPLEYILHLDGTQITALTTAMKEAAPDLFARVGFEQMNIASHMGQYAEVVKAAGITGHAAAGVDFVFHGIDLGQIPQFNVFKESFWNWNTIGGFLIVILSASTSIVSMLVGQKLNNSVVTNEKGLQDKEAAKKSQANSTGKTMMFMMPMMSLFIGFTMPAALSLYWFAGGAITVVIDIFLTKKYRKIYDAEDASKLRKALIEEQLEMERERIRAERRAANPDGITQNTSKKKMQQSKQREEEAARAAAQKEYNAKRGIVEEETENKGPAPLSGDAERPYSKGRAYVADRYSSADTEE